jgi:hypothetical protein
MNSFKASKHLFIEKEIHKEKEEVHKTTIILENLILFYFINNKITENH